MSLISKKFKKIKKKHISEKTKISKIFRKMNIYILFFGNYITVVVSFRLWQYVYLSIFLILHIANNLMLATLIDFSHSSRNSNKEEEKPSKFLYLLNPDDKLQSILNFDEIMIVRFTGIRIGIGIIQFC